METESEIKSPDESARFQDNFFRSFKWKVVILIAIFLIYLIVLYFLFFCTSYKQPIIDFFNLFENSSHILSIYYFKIVHLFYHPNFTEIAILLGFIFAILYYAVSIEKHGTVIIENDDFSSKYVQTIFFIVTFFNFILILPYGFYLVFIAHQYNDVILIVALYVVSLLIYLIFRGYVQLMHKYDLLDRFYIRYNQRAKLSQKQMGIKLQTEENITRLTNVSNSEKFRILKEVTEKNNIFKTFSVEDNLIDFMNLKPFFKMIIYLSMILILFVSYWQNFNFLTLLYAESIFSFWLFMILAMNFLKGPISPIKGLVNVHLKSGHVFNRVFIIEESNNYITTLHEGDIIKKVMVDSIDFTEASDNDIFNN